VIGSGSRNPYRLELVEDPGVDPLVPPGADRGRRAGAVSDPRVRGAEHQGLRELVEHDPVRNPGSVTAERMRIDVRRDQRGEFDPDRLDHRKWHGGHECLGSGSDFTPLRLSASGPSPHREPIALPPIRVIAQPGTMNDGVEGRPRRI
jgi:hypothetical protein